MDNKENRLSEGLGYMLSLVNKVKLEDRMIEGERCWRADKVRAYLEKKKKFLERLMLAMYLTGGQPARGTELGSIKFRNTSLSNRNIFLYRGMVCYTTEYIKPRSITALSYYVVRYLPKDVGEMVLIYLAFIRPFGIFLYNQINDMGGISDGDYLFNDDGKADECWGGKELGKMIVKESKGKMGSRLNIWCYRHVALAITKRHIKEISIYFGEDDEKEKERFMMSKMCDIYAWQAGHSSQTNVHVYGLDTAYPNKLQPNLLDEYWRASLRWQEWLGLDGKGREMIKEVSDRTRRISGSEVSMELSPISSQQTAIIAPSTPRKRKEREEEEEVEEEVDESILSPESKRLNNKIKNLRRQMQLRRELKRLNMEEDI